LRARLYWMGLHLGDGLVDALAKDNLPGLGSHLRAVAAACAGGLAGYLALDFGANQAGVQGLELAAGCLGVGVLAYWLAGKQLPGYALLYFAAALAGVAGAML
jgi:PTS system mannose-specific IID component